jgi:hypothetical protein
MGEIVNPESVKFFVAGNGAGVLHIGHTETHQVTSSGQPQFVVYDNQIDYLGGLGQHQAHFDPLPDEGEWLEQGDIYSYADDLLMVRQSHYRTHHEPADVPALFLIWREDIDGLEWIVGEQVYVGTLRRYEDVTYRAIQAHVTQTDWTPPAVPALWEIYEPEEPGDPWQSGTIYLLDAVVTHNSITWQSRRNNNSWEPGTSDSGWLQIAPLPGNWYYLGGEGYPLDWEVNHNGQLWRNTSAGNHWEPGVFGWVVV